jgi:Tfp pilus assembly protein PilF
MTEFVSPTGESPDMFKYFATQFSVVLKYITLIFIPKGLSIYHSIPIVENFMEIKTLMSIMAIILLILLSVRMLRVNIISSMFIFWFFIALLPTSSILPGCIVMNEHRVYLPGIRIIAGLVILLYKLIPEKIHKNILPIFLSIIIILFSAITYGRNKDWKDEASLWSKTVKLYPKDGIAQYYLGMGLYKKGFIDKSIESFEKAIEYRPNDSLIHNNLGATYINKNMIDKALEEFKKSVSLDSGRYDAFNNLAGAFFLKGFYGDAIECYKKAIELNPFYIDAYANLGFCYSSKKLYNEARNIYSKALEIDPDCINIRNRLQSIKDY